MILHLFKLYPTCLPSPTSHSIPLGLNHTGILIFLRHGINYHAFMSFASLTQNVPYPLPYSWTLLLGELLFMLQNPAQLSTSLGFINFAVVSQLELITPVALSL